MVDNMIEQEMKTCLIEFYKFYNQDQYISKMQADKFLDKYSELFKMIPKFEDKNNKLYKKIKQLSQYGYKIIDAHNEKYLEKKLKEEKEYFDHMFEQVDPNILLDEEQRKAIIIDEDYSLIVAGAGSGKTTTMAAKVKYLVEKRKVKPDKIILLAFTNKAAEELDIRINGDFKLGVEILTFHKLGMKFIRQTTKEKVSIIGKSGQYQLLASYVKNKIFPNKKLLKTWIESFPKEVYFDEKCLSYETFEEYWRYYTDMKYEQCKDNLTKEIKRKIHSREKYKKTINGEYLKSEGEVKIANYLYRNSIPYAYEAIYPMKLSNQRTYKPDFTIYAPGNTIYLEYYGLAAQRKDRTIDSYDLDYKNKIYKKRQVHMKNQTDLIELFGRYGDGTSYLPVLSYELKKRGIIKNKKSEKEIFYRLLETSQDSLFSNFINIAMTFINLWKEQNKDIDDLNKMIDQETDKVLKKQLEIMRCFYLQYEMDIKKQNKIDFTDMINSAYKNMERMKNENQTLDYQYMIIDEYQDISNQRYQFAKRLSELFKAKIVAVGDDWQAIFSFSGSDVDLFTKFYELMGYAQIVQITKTYRNSQELIDLAGEFVSKNTKQFSKKLISDKHLEQPVELIEYDETIEENELAEALKNLLNKISEEHPDDNILLLGRYHKDLDNIIESKYFKKGINERVILREQPKLKIDFLTIHQAKGVGYDQVILLNALEDTFGFPSQIKDHPLIQLIKKEESSEIEFPEERRLFYVALTRTKNKIYIMCPKQTSLKSKFIKEIMGNTNVKI